MLEKEEGEQLQQAFPNYKYEKSLGRGASGRVFLVSDRQTQQRLAVKKISCFGMCEYERGNAVNEVRLLASLDHSNVITFQAGMFDTNQDDLYLFMEYAPQGDLALLIQQARFSKKRVSEHTVWNVLLQLADALEYLHANNIIHRDIKPANIFKTASGVYKLGDLNVSKILANGHLAKTKTGSPLYTCPQVWNKEEGYNEKCDVWSLGVVAYELTCLKVPYEAESIEGLMMKQKTTRLKNIPSGYSSALNELIHQMLQYFPKRRISAEGVKAVCLRALKMEQRDNLTPLDPLMETIVIPESEQRWINLVPLPPKAKKEPSMLQRKESKEISSAQAASNPSNIFSARDNKSLLIPKSRNSHEKLLRVRLPSVKRKDSFNELERKRRDSINELESRVAEKSRQKSRSKSRENTRASETPDQKEATSNRIIRKR